MFSASVSFRSLKAVSPCSFSVFQSLVLGLRLNYQAANPREGRDGKNHDEKRHELG